MQKRPCGPSFAALLTSALLLNGCSSQTQADGGILDDFVPLDWDQDQGPEDSLPQNCNQENGLCLVFKTSATACGESAVPSNEWRDRFAYKGMIRFREGMVDLPTDQPTFNVNLIEWIRVGRTPQQLTPKEPGQFTYQFVTYGSPQEADHLFEFQQAFDWGGQDYRVILRAVFYVRSGQLLRNRIVVGNDFTGVSYLDGGSLQGSGYLGQGVGAELVSNYGGCYLGWLPLWVVSADVTAGAQQILHKRFQRVLAGESPAAIVWALSKVGTEAREVSDFFRLGYRSTHHNFDEGYAVLLDPPAGEVHGIAFQKLGTPEEWPTEIIHLGPDLEELRRVPLTGYNEAEQP